MLLLTSLSIVSMIVLKKKKSDPVKSLKKATRFPVFPVFFLVGFTLIKYAAVKLYNNFRCLCQEVP